MHLLPMFEEHCDDITKFIPVLQTFYLSCFPYDDITKFIAMNRGIFLRDRGLEREVRFGFSQAYAGFLRFRGTDREIINIIHDNP